MPPTSSFRVGDVLEKHRLGVCAYMRDVRAYLGCGDRLGCGSRHAPADDAPSDLEEMLLQNCDHLCPIVGDVYGKLECEKASDKAAVSQLVPVGAHGYFGSQPNEHFIIDIPEDKCDGCWLGPMTV